MIEYNVGDKKFGCSYQELKEEHLRFVGMTDKQFKKNLPAALHLAVFLCWFKELPSGMVLCDDGIIHQLVHLLHLKNEPIITDQFDDIRNLFNTVLALN